MIIPSIDIQSGHTVQLIGGKDLALDAGDPRPIAGRFGMVGEIAVVDLDAAMGQGDNTGLIRELLPLAPCRIGGGIRTVEAAIHWLDAGATKVVLGTAARPEILRQLPKERVVAALDAVDGEVVVDGWRTRTGRGIVDQMRELRPFVGGFLVTFVEREGRLAGTDMGRVRGLIEAADGAELTIAGGVTTPAEIAELDRLGAHAQVGMALYTGRFDLAAALTALLTSDRPDGLWPTVVTDERGTALGLAWSNEESLRQAITTRRGVYHSRTRGLWIKGQTSGATQKLLRVDLDCDRDCLRFTVHQQPPGFCHRETQTCWGVDTGLGSLERRLRDIATSIDTQAPSPGPHASSYTVRLLNDDALLQSKLIEEAGELAAACDAAHVAEEAADLIYFAMVKMVRSGVTLEQVERVLDRRSRRVTRRPGDAKPHKESHP